MYAPHIIYGDARIVQGTDTAVYGFGDLNVNRDISSNRNNEALNDIVIGGGSYVILETDPKTINFTTSVGNTVARLPDATTLPEGWEIQIVNNDSSTEVLNVEDDSGGNIVDVEIGELTNVVLVDGSLAAGVWKLFQSGAETLEETLINGNSTGNYEIVISNQPNAGITGEDMTVGNGTDVAISGGDTSDLTGVGGNVVLEAGTGVAGLGRIILNTDTNINGNLIVAGTVTGINSDDLLVADSNVYLNNGYNVNVANAGGITVNYFPTAINDDVDVAGFGFVAGVPAVSNPIVETVNPATFSIGDLIQIDSATEAENNGLFEVLSHVGTTLTIRGIGLTGTVEGFTQNQFKTDASGSGGRITKVNISVISSGTDGDWEVGKGNVTPIVFTKLNKEGDVSLQDAYNNSSPPEIELDNALGGIVVKDSAGGVGANLFEISNNTGTFAYLKVDTVLTELMNTLQLNNNYFMASNPSVAGGTFAAVATDIIWNTEVRKDSIFTFVGPSSSIVFGLAGDYKITVDLTTDKSTSGIRSETQYWLTNDTGSGAVEITNSRSVNYNRSTSVGTQTSSINLIHTFGVGDSLQVMVQRTLGNGNMIVVANASRIMVQKI